MNNQEKLQRVLQQILNIELHSTNDDTPRAAISAWDSFAGFMLIAELEKEFGVQFNTSDIDDMQTIGAIKQTLIVHGITL